MDIRYFIDPETGLPHIRMSFVDRSRTVPAEKGRVYLRIISVSDPVPDSIFVITAYPLGWRALRALRRRRRRGK